MEWWVGYLAIGLIAGFLAGLLGIGGGALSVPMLVFVFTAQRLPSEHLLHVAPARHERKPPDDDRLAPSDGGAGKRAKHRRTEEALCQRPIAARTFQR